MKFVPQLTVAELIKELQQCPADAKVSTSSSGCCCGDAVYVSVSAGVVLIDAAGLNESTDEEYVKDNNARYGLTDE